MQAQCVFLQRLGATLAVCVSRGDSQVVVHYITCKRIHKSVAYGKLPRNMMDIHLPVGRAVGDRAPVIIYVTGEQHRCLCCPLERRLSWPSNAGASLQPSWFYDPGGAWIIGYKAWGTLLAERLSRAGVLVCCLDYRNFPQVGMHTVEVLCTLHTNTISEAHMALPKCITSEGATSKSAASTHAGLHRGDDGGCHHSHRLGFL